MMTMHLADDDRDPPRTRRDLAIEVAYTLAVLLATLLLCLVVTGRL